MGTLVAKAPVREGQVETTGLPTRRDAVRQAGWMLSGGVVQSGVAFGANLILVRHISPEGFGRFALLMASVSLVLAVLSLRTGLLVIREGARGAGAIAPERRDLFVNALYQETIFCGLLALGWTLVAGQLDLAAGVLLAALLLAHLLSNLKAFHERQMAYRSLSVLESGSQLAGHGVAVALALLGAGAAALYARELALALVGLIGLASLRALPTVRWRWLRPRDWAGLAHEAKDVWLDGALEGGFARVLVLAAGAIGGPAGAGLFFQAHRLATVPHQLLAPLAGRLAYNWFSRAETEAARRTGRRRLMLTLAGPLLAAGVATWFLADSLVPWLLGERWADAAPLLATMVGCIVGTSLFATAKMYVLATRRARILVIARVAQFLGLGLGLGLVLLAPGLGVRAVGIGLSLAFAFGLVTALAGLRAAERD
ncbi:lipopolysaccharide biosynthesis protein [Engelhardtia mirabilis]|uniref:Colanic acid exporter n=1 Tax=Engelhardtia mirabilis TaxID=2528011 RepID=A0A518BJJ4_9BACT|nr:colanic acid exporter [Planctomycetes bacterium Pla133]QDV01473.1 colanic acid exporter [Planctomycetes bacterium Pla86]